MEMLTNRVQSYWWLTLVRGIAAVLFGILALFWPAETLLVLVILFGIYALIDGIVAVIVSLQGRHSMRHWWVLLLEGIAGIIFGILTFAWPGITALILLYVVAAWAIITGVMEIAAAFSWGRTVGEEWALAIAGVLSVAFGLILSIFPGRGLLSLVWLLGIYAIIFGILLVVRAFRFRSQATRLLGV